MYSEPASSARYHGIIDTHAHMDDPCFCDHLSEVLASEQEKGVEMIIQSGSELPSSRRSVELACKYDCLVASVGVYPDEVLGIPEDYLDQIRELACRTKRVVAIGEIGMDRGFPGHPPMEPQAVPPCHVSEETVHPFPESGAPTAFHAPDPQAFHFPDR